MRRRDFIGCAAVAAPALIGADRPRMKWGVQIGDVAPGRAIVWAKSDRNARLIVEWDTTDRFADIRKVTGPSAQAATDFTARVDLTRLPAGQRIFYRAMFEGGEPITGSFRTPPDARSTVRFLWGGDTAGQ